MGADFKTGLAFWGFGFFLYDRDPKKMMRMENTGLLQETEATGH